VARIKKRKKRFSHLWALVSSYRLLIVTTSPSAAVWMQFATQLSRGGVSTLVWWERGGVGNENIK